MPSITEIQLANRALKMLNHDMAVTPRYASALLNVIDAEIEFTESTLPTWQDEDLRESREVRHGRIRRRVWLA